MQEWNIIVGAEIVQKNVICHNVLFLLCFLQRVSIACYAERCTSYSKSVRPSGSHWHCQNDSSYDHAVFTVG